MEVAGRTTSWPQLLDVVAHAVDATAVVVAAGAVVVAASVVCAGGVALTMVVALLVIAL